MLRGLQTLNLYVLTFPSSFLFLPPTFAEGSERGWTPAGTGQHPACCGSLLGTETLLHIRECVLGEVSEMLTAGAQSGAGREDGVGSGMGRGCHGG